MKNITLKHLRVAVGLFAVVLGLAVMWRAALFGMDSDVGFAWFVTIITMIIVVILPEL